MTLLLSSCPAWDRFSESSDIFIKSLQKVTHCKLRSAIITSVFRWMNCSGLPHLLKGLMSQLRVPVIANIPLLSYNL